MAFEQLFEQLGEALKLFGENAGAKVQSLVETSAANSKINDAKKKLNQSYLELGKGTYEKYAERPIEGLETAFGAVRDSLDSLDELTAQLQRIKGTKACPNCGREFPLDENFCSSCGTALPVIETPDPAADVKPGESEPLVVSTTYGKVQGVEETGYVAFKGIPFAKPPVGQLRFKPPVDPESWEGVRICDAYGPIEPRPVNSIGGVVGGASETPCSEDCLYLNVYTPAIDGKKRPVLFNIHGGAFQTGDHSLNSDPAGTTAMDCVLVTASYRLGVLGFLQLDRYLGEEYIQSGNSGMLDTIKALEWVHSNIGAFGGDPERVIVQGSLPVQSWQVPCSAVIKPKDFLVLSCWIAVRRVRLGICILHRRLRENMQWPTISQRKIQRRRFLMHRGKISCHVRGCCLPVLHYRT